MSLAYSNIWHFSSYDIFAINIASTMLGYLYGAAKGPSLNSAQSLGVKVATPVGTFCGQLLFGWLADVVGRKRMCMYSALSPYPSSYFTYRRYWAPDHHCCYFWPSCIGNWWCSFNYWCFGCLALPRKPTSFSSSPLSLHPQMGVGVGGDYPLSAVISSEFASTKIRGRMMTAVFAAQGWGNFGTFHLAPIINFSF